MSSLRLALLLLLCSCATATDNDIEPAPAPDARKGVSFPDAGPQVDAGPLPDAAPAIFDAAPGAPDADPQGLFCEDNGDCTVSGECCVTLGGPGFCAAGTEIGSACLPD